MNFLINFLVCGKLNIVLLLVKHVLTPSAKIVLTPLGLSAVELSLDACVLTELTDLNVNHNNHNFKWRNVNRIVKSLKESDLLIKVVGETIKKTKGQKGGFIGKLFGTFGTTL